MQFKTLNRGEAQIAMNNWIANYPSLPEVQDEYKTIRSDLQGINQKIRNDAGDCSDIKYYVDAHFGLELYKYFNEMPDFTMRVASNDDFWRYMSLIVIPDIVAQRWGKDNETHFWSRNSRIWLKSIWWFVHMSWQGDYSSTLELMECDHFSTDTILNIEERSGRHGIYIETCRAILRCYANVKPEDIKKYSRGHMNNSDDLFRVVMKLNTARLMVMEPLLFSGGENEYARSLFMEAGVKL